MTKTKTKTKTKKQYTKYLKQILITLSFPIWYPIAIIISILGWLCEEDLIGPAILVGIILAFAEFGIWLETGKNTKYTPCQQSTSDTATNQL